MGIVDQPVGNRIDRIAQADLGWLVNLGFDVIVFRYQLIDSLQKSAAAGNDHAGWQGQGTMLVKALANPAQDLLQAGIDDLAEILVADHGLLVLAHGLDGKLLIF